MAQYEITLRDYWRILRRRKGIVAFTALLLGIFSFVLAVLWQPQPLYRAVAKVQINTTQTLTSLYLQKISYNAGDQLETQRAIITSFPVLKRAGEALGLFAGGDTARVVLDLQNRIVARQEGYTNIIAIEVTDRDPESVRQLANAVARVYQEYDHELKNQQAVRNRRFVEEQRDKARQALEEAEEEVRRYRQEAELVSLDAQAGVILGQITEAEREVVRLEQVRRDIDAMLQEIERRGTLSEQAMQGSSKLQAGDTFMALSQQLNLLRLEREGLLVQFTEDHPQIQQLQVKIDQLVKSMVGELRQRRLAVDRDLEGVKARLEKLRLEYSELPSRGLTLARLQREVDLRQEVVTALEEEYQRALIREADKIEGVTVLQWAIAPTRPINPNHPLKRAGVGVALGIVLGIVFAVVAEIMDTSIGTIEDVQEYTGTQVVGIIPFIRLDEVAASLRRRGQESMSQRSLQRKAQLVSYFDPQSTLAESFRTLRTNLEFVTVEKGIKSLMVTSSTSREGKSTVAANLAMIMAQLGKRTLLVDGDLRKPALARLFGLDREPGLTEVIVGNYSWGEVVRTVTDIVTGGMDMEDLMQAQGISNLHIITSGAIPPNPTELLNSRRMSQFLEQVAQAYDIILFDVPPILHVTDAAILGKKVDGALMIYRAGEVSRTSLRHAVNLLRSVEVTLLGVVLNGVRAEVSADYYDFGYRSYYAYGREKEERRRGLVGRLGSLMRRWQKEEVGGEEEEEAVEEAEEEFEEWEGLEAGERTAGRRMGKIAAACLLALTGLGIVWQSGYLNLSLGLPPVLVGHRPPEKGQRLALPSLETLEPTAEREEGLPSIPTPPVPEATGASVVESLATPAAQAPMVSEEVLEFRYSPMPFSIQVAAYVPRSLRPGRLLAKLRQAGETAFLAPADLDGQRLIRLLIGSFPTREAALAHARELEAKGMLEEFIVARLPYAVESARAPDREQANLALGQLGENDRFAYVQVGEEGVCRILLGAFADAGQAQAFAAHLPGETSAQVVRR